MAEEKKTANEETEESKTTEEAAEEMKTEAADTDKKESKSESKAEEEKKKSDSSKDKKKKTDKKDEQIEALTDQVKRQMAEFENFRKRTEKEKSQMYEIGAKSIVEKVLPAVDSFERGFDQVKDREDDAFVSGMQMVYKQLMTALNEAGVTEIEAVGKEFNPDLHNAVMHIDDEAYGENEVAEVLQKGYMYHDSVVRHAMVKVAN